MEFPGFRAALVQCSFAIMFIGMMISDKCGAAHSKPQFSTILVFGDSVFDAGNNNYLRTVCQSNHPPYGLRFPGGIPTGRFSDGKLVPDFLASRLGIKDTVPPYLQPNLSDHELITGVSFASACARLDDQNYSIPDSKMSKQTEFLKDYVQRLTRIFGKQKAKKIVNEALVIVHVGGNDFLYHFNILSFNKSTVVRSNSSPNDYGDFLLEKLQTLLKDIYDVGCRRMLLVGIPAIGCLPLTLTTFSPFQRKCVEAKNLEAQSYNRKLVKLLPQIQANLPGSKLQYFDTVGSVLDMIHRPQSYGLVETGKGCCGTGLFEFGPFCNALTPACSNSSLYLFWDAIHPSETVYRYFSKQIYNIL